MGGSKSLWMNGDMASTDLSTSIKSLIPQEPGELLIFTTWDSGLAFTQGASPEALNPEH